MTELKKRGHEKRGVDIMPISSKSLTAAGFFSATFNDKSSVIMWLRTKQVILLRGHWLLPDSGRLSTVGAPPGTWKGSTKLTRKKIVILKKH